MEGVQQPPLSRDVGRTCDASARWRKAHHRQAAVEVDPVAESGVTLGDDAHRSHRLAQEALQVGADLLVRHATPSRWAMSARLPTIRRSPNTRTMLTLV